MSIVSFARAQRQGAPILIAMYGLSGSGKTYSALLMAGGLAGPNGRIALLDTESGRGKIYADEPGMPPYDHGALSPPFTPERYIQAIRDAEAAGYNVLVIDSASHEWEGEGGVVEEADEGKDKNGNHLQGLVKWAKPKARHKKFIGALLTTKMHLIICLRAKEKLVQKGRDVVSEGFVPIQDKRFIFETTVQLFFQSADEEKNRGIPVLEKCPRALHGAFPSGQRITIETGKRIAEWIAGGLPVDHELEKLKASAREIAATGTAAFRAWWRDNPGVRGKLSADLENLKSIATEADAESARQTEAQRNQPVAFVSAKQEGEALSDDPFGGSGAAEITDAPQAEEVPEPINWDAWLDDQEAQLAAMPAEERPDAIKAARARMKVGLAPMTVQRTFDAITRKMEID